MDTIREHLKFQWWRFWFRIRYRMRKVRKCEPTPQIRVVMYDLDGKEYTVLRHNAAGYVRYGNKQ